MNSLDDISLSSVEIGLSRDTLLLVVCLSVLALVAGLTWLHFKRRASRTDDLVVCLVVFPSVVALVVVLAIGLVQ